MMLDLILRSNFGLKSCSVFLRSSAMAAMARAVSFLECFPDAQAWHFTVLDKQKACITKNDLLVYSLFSTSAVHRWIRSVAFSAGYEKHKKHVNKHQKIKSVNIKKKT